MTYELPLFPLNTVLFPSTPVYLHIFEARYLQMIDECIEQRRLFGVVLIKRGSEALGPLAEPYRVGCTAEIAEVEKLPQGRLNLVAVGRERFRILSLDEQSRLFLVGTVEPFPLEESAPGALEEAAAALRPWLERYLRLLPVSGEGQLALQELPAEPQTLISLAAALLQVPPVQKQTLLEAPGLTDIAAGLLAMLRREVSFLQAMHSKKAGPGKEPFSQN
jgi:Lon protease-like protein